MWCTTKRAKNSHLRQNAQIFVDQLRRNDMLKWRWWSWAKTRRVFISFWIQPTTTMFVSTKVFLAVSVLATTLATPLSQRAYIDELKASMAHFAESWISI